MKAERSQGNPQSSRYGDSPLSRKGANGELAAEGGGAVYIHKGSTFAQHQPFPEDPTLKCVYLSMTLMNHTN